MVNRIKIYRQRFEMTQIELAKKINVTKDYISMIERGKRRPSLAVAKKLAEVFESTVDEVFFRFK